jgi:hypothetical protein
MPLSDSLFQQPRADVNHPDSDARAVQHTLSDNHEVFQETPPLSDNHSCVSDTALSFTRHSELSTWYSKTAITLNRRRARHPHGNHAEQPCKSSHFYPNRTAASPTLSFLKTGNRILSFNSTLGTIYCSSCSSRPPCRSSILQIKLCHRVSFWQLVN